MKKVVLIYGLIAGSIVVAMGLITMPMYETGQVNFDNGELIGYTTMTVALSMIFFGVKSYRDNYSEGDIRFWKAVKIGLLITAVAAVMYALGWEISYHNMHAGFMHDLIDHEIKQLVASGATEAEIAKSREDWAAFAELYKNPFIRFGITLLEITPIGIGITLISAVLLRRKNFLPAQTKVGSTRSQTV
jgi:hypothetical protein